MKFRHFADSGAGMIDAIFTLIIEVVAGCTIGLAPFTYFGRGKMWALLLIIPMAGIGILFSAVFFIMFFTGGIDISRSTSSEILYIAQVLLTFIVVSIPGASALTAIYLWHRPRK